MNIIKRIYNAIKYTGGDPQNPQYWVKRLFGSNETESGIVVDEDIAMKYSAFWSAVNVISGAMGFMPLVTYQRGRDNSRDRALNHPVYNLLRTRPNPYMSAQSFKETLTAHAMVWGNGYSEIEYSKSGRPINLWPLLPNRTQLRYNNDRKFYYEIYRDSGDSFTLDYDQVYHIHGLGFDGYTGYSVIQYAANNIGLSMAAERDANTFYMNDSSPSGIITTDSVLNTETKEKVEKGWEDKHRGRERFRIAVLHSGLKYQSIGIPAKDAQLLESRKYGVTDIARWFQIPPHMLADLERSTYSNIEHQGMEFVTMTLQKWMERWKQEADYKLFTEAERSRYFVDWIVDILLRGDSKTRSEVYQIALGGNNNPGYMTVNEVRQRENLPPVDDGDGLFHPSYGNNEDKSADPVDLFNNIFSRIVTKEIKAISRACKKEDNFSNWAEEFYEKHKKYAEDIVKPAIKACFGDPVSYSVSYQMEERKALAIQSFNNGTIDNLLEDWQIYETEKQTNLLLSEVKNEKQLQSQTV